MSSLSKGDGGRKTLDFYSHSLPENEQHKLRLSDGTCTATDGVTTVRLDDHLDEEDSSTSILLTCPICNKPVCDDNNLLNSHIDECLNQQVIGLEKSVSPLTPRKHKRLFVFTSLYVLTL